MGNACQLPWHCLHLFVPAKRDTVDGYSENNLHVQRIACGIDGIDLQDAEVHGPAITTNIVMKKEVITGRLALCIWWVLDFFSPCVPLNVSVLLGSINQWA